MHVALLIPDPRSPVPRAARSRGAAAVLAMMFLVIFGSLAAAMAIVSQGNLRTADSQLKIGRSLAAAETGLNLLTFRLNQVTLGDPYDPEHYPGIKTRDGLIHDGNSDDPDGNALALWNRVTEELGDVMFEDDHYADPDDLPRAVATEDANGRTVYQFVIHGIQISPDSPKFDATLTPHPLPGENYDAPRYQAPPYDGGRPETGIDWDVSNARPLDARFIRVKVTAYDGELGSRVYRSVSMDFRLGKTIPYAILSRSRVMIGRNVLVNGNIGSRFLETHLDNGHPVQMESDFRGLSDALDDAMDTFTGFLTTNDIDGDNRLRVASPTETEGLADPAADDVDGDGYITDFDLFLAEFDTASSPGRISLIEMTDQAKDPVAAAQLFDLMDGFGKPSRDGFDDGFLDADDLYTKIKGEVSTLATAQDWNDGAAGGNYRSFLQGTINPRSGQSAFKTADPALEVHSYEAANFNVKSLEQLTTGTVDAQAGVANDPSKPVAGPSEQPKAVERVPYGATYPYDYYERPVYTNMIFNNVKIPKGTNALFENCRFVGVTYVELETYNGDANYNYAGMWEDGSGTEKHPDKFANVNGHEIYNTKTVANNVRFHNCTFEGAVVSGDADGNQPTQFAHVRNKVTFTGRTIFNIEDSVRLSDEDKARYKRSAILLPHVSVEMGSFDRPADDGEVLTLSGTIVAGLIDMRGQITVNGSVITTFEPVSGVSPVVGDTSPQFNTTLGYFSLDQGDYESELPSAGLGRISITYDPTLALPDGIDGPIELKPIVATYSEGGR